MTYLREPARLSGAAMFRRFATMSATAVGLVALVCTLACQSEPDVDDIDRNVGPGLTEEEFVRLSFDAVLGHAGPQDHADVARAWSDAYHMLDLPLVGGIVDHFGVDEEKTTLLDHGLQIPILIAKAKDCASHSECSDEGKRLLILATSRYNNQLSFIGSVDGDNEAIGSKTLALGQKEPGTGEPGTDGVDPNQALVEYALLILLFVIVLAIAVWFFKHTATGRQILAEIKQSCYDAANSVNDPVFGIDAALRAGCDAIFK